MNGLRDGLTNGFRNRHWKWLEAGPWDRLKNGVEVRSELKVGHRLRVRLRNGRAVRNELKVRLRNELAVRMWS